MLKIVGILFLMTGATGVAWSWCREQKERLETLKSIRQIYEYLQTEMDYAKAALPEICRRLSGRPTPFRLAFEEIYKEIDKNNGCCFEEIWQKYMGESLQQLPLKEKEREILLGFPECLGFRDGKGQAGGIEKYIEEASSYSRELEEELKNKNKIAMCLGVMGGMMAVILLL